jgi:hypothetical protein
MSWLAALEKIETATPAPSAKGGQGQKSITRSSDFMDPRHRISEGVDSRLEEDDDKDC